MEDKRSQLAKKNFICAMCGHVGRPKTITRGSFFIEIILWFFFIIPGLIYSIWRLTTKGRTCPTCGNSSMIPLNTPKGLELLKSAKRNSLDDTFTKKPWWKPQGILGWLITFFVLLLILGVLRGIFKGSDTTTSKEPIKTAQQQLEPGVTQVKSGKFLSYEYEIGQEKKTNQYVAIFKPFLPSNDTLVKGFMLEMVNQVWGKHKIVNLEPNTVERDSKNLLMFQGEDGNYYFLLVKGSNNEGVISFVFWKE